MGIMEFSELHPRTQRQILLKTGVPLGKRESKRFSIYLYALYSFYVELYFFKQSGEYASLRPFAEVEQLVPYLQQINLEELLAK